MTRLPAAAHSLRDQRQGHPAPHFLGGLFMGKGSLTRLRSCLRAAGRSTRHDVLARLLHTGKTGPRGASASPKHHAAAATARSG
jgi:hypothetical protein